MFYLPIFTIKVVECVISVTLMFFHRNDERMIGKHHYIRGVKSFKLLVGHLSLMSFGHTMIENDELTNEILKYIFFGMNMPTLRAINFYRKFSLTNHLLRGEYKVKSPNLHIRKSKVV